MVSCCVKQVVAFIRSVPEMTSLSGSDQRSVIAASLHRLLLLFMAESNIHFVVAPVLRQLDTDRITDCREDQKPVRMSRVQILVVNIGSGPIV